MAVSWGAGNTDFKFYTGSSQSNAWTRDLLWKKYIKDEAKIRGYAPGSKAAKAQAAMMASQSEPALHKSTRAEEMPAEVDSANAGANAQNQYLVAPPSARQSSMNGHMATMRRRLQKEAARKEALIERAEKALEESPE